MAWALVSAFKDQLSSVITSEFTSIANVEGEVQKLESKFHTIQAMLNDAEKQQVKEETVKRWLDKLKDVSYLMDDVLDEWNTAMIKEEIEKQQKDDEEKAETSAAKKRKIQFTYVQRDGQECESEPKYYVEDFDEDDDQNEESNEDEVDEEFDEHDY
ncbi:hypothetical protein CMV_009686 [Castanea mollissima]|uniref:Disease resistance N-terminal domain-containing protein n=1 Tax=Castanea mollissima TaxID=60419 RepID=A0A8J4RH23_9ROSI|nr:hypothetical protein CMV_009686 [Castanea mollissima]